MAAPVTSPTSKGKAGITSAKPSPKELDWFNFQTKMRGVISQIVEPIILKQLEDRESIMAIRKVNENYKKRIQDLEYSLNKSKKKETLFDEIQRKMAENQSQRKIAEAKLQQQLTNLNSQITLIQEKDIMVQQEITQHTKQLEFQMTEFVRQHQHFSEYKTVVAEQIAAVARDVSDSFNELKVNDMDRDNKITLNETLLNSHSEALKQYQQDIEQHTFKVETLHEEVAELRACKVEIQKYIDDFTMIKRELTGNRYSCDDISSRLKETDNYLDKYLPIKIQTMVGDTLHKFLPYEEEVRLCGYEEEKFGELREIVLKDNGIPSLEKKKYHIPEIVVPQRPVSSKRASSMSKKISRRNMGSSGSAMSSGKDGGSSGQRKTIAKSRQGSTVLGSKESMQEGITKENLKIISQDSMNLLNPGIDTSSVASPRTGQSVDLEGTSSVEQLNYSKHSRHSKMSKQSRYSKQAIKIEENAAQQFTGAVETIETLEQEKQMVSGGSSLQSSGTSEFESGEQAKEEKPEEKLQEVPSENEEEYSEDKAGMMVSQGFIDDILQKAEKQARNIVESTIDRTLAERDYEFKMDVIAKKLDEGMAQLRAEMMQDFTQREKKLQSEIEEVKYYCKNLQTEIEEEVKRRKRDKSDLMIDLTDLHKELTADSKDIEEIKLYLKSIAELTNVLAQISQIECSLEAQDQEDRKSVALMGIKDNPLANQNQREPPAFSTTSSAERVQTAIPVARREEDSARKKELPTIKTGTHIRAMSNVEAPMSPQSNTQEITQQFFSPRVPKKPVVNMDRQALAASGSSSLMQQMFKMACLAYLPTKVNYRGGVYSRQQLIYMRGKLLQNAWKNVKQQQFAWSPIKQGKSLFDEVLKEEAGNDLPGPSLRGDSPSNYDIFNPTRTPETSPGPSNAKFDALSLSQTAPGGIDGYLANAVARRGSGLHRPTLNQRNLLVTRDKGNLIGEMSLRRLKQQVKTRVERKSHNEDPRTNRSLNIGFEGGDTHIIQTAVNPVAIEYLRQNQTYATLSPTSVRTPVTSLKTRIHGFEKRPASKQSSNAGGGGYFAQNQLDPRYDANRATTAGSVPKKNL